MGRTLQQIESWPDAISKVTADDIKRVAATYLDTRRSVTGYLLPARRLPVLATDGQPVEDRS